MSNKAFLEFDHQNVAIEFAEHLISKRVPFSFLSDSGNYSQIFFPEDYKEEALKFLDEHFTDGEVIDQDSDGFILWNADSRTTYCITEEVEDLTPAEKWRIKRQ